MPGPHLGQVIAEAVKKEQPLAHPLEVKAQLHQGVVYARKLVDYVVNLIPLTNLIYTIISKFEYNLSEKYSSIHLKLNEYYLIKCDKITMNYFDYRDEVDEDMTCQICLQPFVEPLDTPCGHTFCRACLLSYLKVNPMCPLDRKPLNEMVCQPSNLVLKRYETRYNLTGFLIPSNSFKRFKTIKFFKYFYQVAR